MSKFVRINGLSDLQKVLNELPVKMERNVMRSALRAGAQVVLKGAQANINDDTRALSQSLRVSTRAKRGQVTATVKTDLFYAKMVEFGTSQHFITVDEDARPGRITRRGYRSYSISTLNDMVKRGSLVIGGAFVGQSVAHPGARPHPFMRPALDSEAGRALEAVGMAIRRRLTKQGIDVPAAPLPGDE
jgi:HK97 gp10 family phage protein